MPGDALGTFHVTAQLQSDTCQAAFLGVTNPWQFDVELSRKDSAIYWLNGSEAIPGDIAADGTSFSFESGVEVTVVAPRGSVAGCVVDRADSANGQLSSASDDVSGFSSTLGFGYQEAANSDCGPWVGTGDGFAALPCSVNFAASADRTKAPAPE
jgi:hypothetical protein